MGMFFALHANATTLGSFKFISCKQRFENFLKRNLRISKVMKTRNNYDDFPYFSFTLKIRNFSDA